MPGMRQTEMEKSAFFWALQGLCALHRQPFSPELAQQQLAPPHTPDALSRAAQAHGFEATLRKARPDKLQRESFPLIAWLHPQPATEPHLPPPPATRASAATPARVDIVP